MRGKIHGIVYASVDYSKVLRKPSVTLCGRVLRRRPRLCLVTDKNMDYTSSVHRLRIINVPTIVFNGTLCRNHVAFGRLRGFID